MLKPNNQIDPRWNLLHSDAYHPGSRDECEHCQENIRLYGSMPPAMDIVAAFKGSPAYREYPQKAPIPAALRWQVWERDDFRCLHCGTRQRLSIDHIIPESKGGALELSNLQTLCKPCNSRKGKREPAEINRLTATIRRGFHAV